MGVTQTSGYFNAASHGVPYPAVYQRAADYLRCEAEVGPERAVATWATEIANVRRSVADMLGGKPDDIAFSSTTTTAWRSMLSHMDLAGKRVLVAPHDWGEYNRTLMMRGDVTVEVLPELAKDNPDLQAWAARFDDDVAALFVPMVTAVGGYRYPVEEIGTLPRPQGMLYAVDGAQALGQMPVDVGGIGCDAFVATGRKWLRGPRQASMAWISGGCAFKAKDLEPADKNIALLLGLGVAVDHYLGTGSKEVQAQILAKSNQLRDWAALQAIEVTFGTTGSVSLAVEAQKAADVAKSVLEAGIIAKVLDAGRFEPQAQISHPAFLRLSPHVYTTDQDMDELQNLLAEVFGQ